VLLVQRDVRLNKLEYGEHRFNVQYGCVGVSELLITNVTQGNKPTTQNRPGRTTSYRVLCLKARKCNRPYKRSSATAEYPMAAPQVRLR
jgi:hypothetical protein